VPLAQRDLNVIGVDLSEAMLRVARDKATGLLIGWICGNIVRLPIADESCDAAICLFSTLGMIAGVDARRSAIVEALRVVKSGGLFVLHVHNVWHHLGTPAGRGHLWRDLGKRMFRRSSAGDFPMPASDPSPRWTMHLFTWPEIRKLLQSAGFIIDRRIALDVNGNEVKSWMAWRAYGFIIIARRPAGKSL
jgi:ubiquinone/menaquinone biosynthesis C-methylase UbiE